MHDQTSGLCSPTVSRRRSHHHGHGPGKDYLRLRMSVSPRNLILKRRLKGEALEYVPVYTSPKMPPFFSSPRSLPISISPLRMTRRETRFRLSSHPGRLALSRKSILTTDVGHSGLKCLFSLTAEYHPFECNIAVRRHREGLLSQLS
jgi:hypothetical protein